MRATRSTRARRGVAIGIAVLGLAATGCGSIPTAAPPTTLAITGGTVIDGTGAPPRVGATVIVEDGRIARIVDAGSTPMGEGVDIYEAEGRWIVPGFVDVHAHFPPRSELEHTLQTLLDYGITAARAPATITEYGVDIRADLEDGELTGPTFRTAGALLDGPETPWGFATVVDSEADVRAAVREQAAAGVDFIKLYTLLRPEIVRSAIDEAHANDLEVIGHLGRTTWDEAIEFGIDALTHSGIYGMARSLIPPERRDEFREFFEPNADRFDSGLFAAWNEATDDREAIARDLGRRLAAGGTTLDPNLVLSDAVFHGDDPARYERLVPPEARVEFQPHPYSRSWVEADRLHARAAWPRFMEAIRIFHEEGVTLAAGTDLENAWMYPGTSFHRELELLSDTGISNADVLIIATRNGAIAIGLEDELGTIEPGKRADLVILSADPLADIRNTEAIVDVFQRGRRIARSR